MSVLLQTTLVGSYPQPDWLIDRKRLTDIVPPRARANAYNSNPAVRFRVPAIRNGGMDSTAYRIPRYVEPQIT